MCAGRGDETEHKLHGFQHADGRRCGAPSSPVLGTSFFWAVKQEAVKSWPESYGITCGNILWRSSPGSICQTASVGALTSTSSICFLNTFSFFSSRICKRQRPQSINFSLCALPIVRVSVFLMMALCRPGILFDGISGFDSKGLFTFLDSGPEVKRYFTNSLLGKPSSPGSCSWGLKVGTLTFSQVPPALRWENCQNGTGWKLG